MNNKLGFPNRDWAEKEIISLLNTTIQDSSVNAGYKRIKSLEELTKRKIKDRNKVADTLIEIAKKHGTSKPEFLYIIQILSDLAELSNKVYQKLLTGLRDENPPLLSCISKIIRKLNKNQKKKSIKFLMEALMDKDSFTYVTEDMYETLVGMNDEKINRMVVRFTLPYLESPDSYQVIYATKIISRLADKSATPKLCKVIERSLAGWYDSRPREEICNFFQRVKDKRSLPCLFELIRKDPSIEAEKALAAIADKYPEVMNKILRELQKEESFYMLRALKEVNKTKVDIDKLFRIVPTKYFEKPYSRGELKEITIKSGKLAKSKLLEMIKSDKKVEYSFALECLKEIGVSIDEISGIFEENKIIKIYNFFYEKRHLSLEEIWNEQDKIDQKIKRAQIERFDYFIQNLFSAFGFVTLYVDPAGKQGVDIITFSPSTPHLFVVGCTTGVIKDDLQKIDATFKEMKTKLRELIEKHVSIPIIFIAKNISINRTDAEFAQKNKIIILTQEDIEILLEMLKTGRRSLDIIKYIENKKSNDPNKFH